MSCALVQAVLQEFYGPLPSRKRRHTAETAAVKMLREEVAQVRIPARSFTHDCCMHVPHSTLAENADLSCATAIDNAGPWG